MLLNSSGGAADIAGFTDEKLAIMISHELGHVLGLGHVSDPASLMYFNVSEKELLALSRDDAEGVTYLYPRQEPFAGEFMGCGTLAVVSGRGGPGEGLPANHRFSSFSWMALLLSCWWISRFRYPEAIATALTFRK
jgi:hypothetical protein